MKAKRKKKSEPLPPVDDPGPARARPAWWLHVGVLLGLWLANLGLYQGALRLDFLSVDDPDYVQNNPYIENFKPANLKFVLTRPYAANYAPANLLSYAVDVAVSGGKRPQAFHLSNVLWHGLVVGSVYLLAFVMRAEIVPAAGAAVLFMVHPAHVEVVAWISSRKDLVATAFAALAMTCYLVGRRTRWPTTEESKSRSPSPQPSPRGEGGRKATAGTNLDARSIAAAEQFPLPRGEGQGEGKARERAAKGPGVFWAWYMGSILFFLAASAAKQSVLLLPAVMLAWDWLVEERRGWRMVADKIPFGLVTFFFGWMTWHAQPSTNQAASLFVVATTEWTNLWLLSGFGQYTLYRAAPSPAGWGLAARLGVISGAVLIWGLPLIWLRFRRPIRAVLCYWALIQMIPPMLLSFIVPITDRYLFLPSVGMCLLVSDLLFSPKLSRTAVSKEADGGSWSLDRMKLRRHAIGGLVLAMLCVFLGFKTWAYLAEWGDPRSVWYGAHLKTRNAQVAQFLGEVYQNAGDRMNELVKSNVASPTTNEIRLAQAVLGDAGQTERLVAEWQGKSGVRTNTIAYRDKLWELAWQQYQEAVARRGTLSTPNLFMNRGRLMVSEGKSDRAIPEFQAALALAQSSSYDVIRQETGIHALRAIGTAYWHLRNYKEAQQWFLKAQEVQRKCGRTWISTLDDEVRRVQALAAGQP